MPLLALWASLEREVMAGGDGKDVVVLVAVIIGRGVKTNNN
jgi:hypothetical protein